MASVGVLRHWKVLAPGLVVGILLVIVCMILRTSNARVLLLKPSSLQGQDNKFYYHSNRLGYYSLQHRFYSPRRILRNDFPRSRPSPASYPPPIRNVRRAPFRQPQSPPQP